jgi:hypothetical protein
MSGHSILYYACYKQIPIIPAVILVTSILLLSSSMAIQNHQAFARCPNGSHMSPSGDCETVVSHRGLPRCPNGSHRSPGGSCEQVGASENSDGGGSSSTDNAGSEGPTTINNSLPPPLLVNDSTSTIRSESTSAGQCDQSLWNHVYNPQRLQLVEQCKTVSGTIESKRVEADGDYHIRLKLDSQFADLVNQANVNGQLGDLVVEPICMNPVKQLDAISACQNFRQVIAIPPVGSHVQVTGSYVLDKEHGSWAEIHPVTSITNIPYKQYE